MPALLQIGRVVFSLIVVGYLSVISFFGVEIDRETPTQAESALVENIDNEKELRQIPQEIPIKEQSDKEEIQEVVETPIPQTEPSSIIEEVAISQPPIIEGGVIMDVQEPDVITEPVLENSPENTVEPSFSDINTHTRKALVNILCTTKAGGSLQPITGSGVVIDERGVILTNAHIAQFFLLRDYPSKGALDCTIRTGSPAKPTYKAEILHISPAWISDNAEKIIQENPLGTGENDFALLLISEHVNTDEKLPTEFNFVELLIEDETIEQDDEVLIAGYPAGFLGSVAIQKDLYTASSISAIKELFTFRDNTLDLFSMLGSILSQKGASGGAVVSKENKLIGIVVTASDSETTGERELRAITLSHIDRSLLSHTGNNLEFLLFGDLWIKAGVFNLTIAPTLTKTLVTELDK